MNQRHYLLKGTFLLTGTGFLTRIAGFFYKIFLSRTIGAKEIGLFQLTMPVYAFGMAVCIGGIQTAISRFTAEYHARNNRTSVRRILACSLILSVSLAILCAAVLFTFASQIAEKFLLEPSCAPLLQIIAFSLPFCAVHSCISGYFIGCKNVTVPAFSQMVEQMIRIASAFLFYSLFQKNGRAMDAAVMALGQIAGEIASALYCIYCLVYSKQPVLHSAKKRLAGIQMLTEYRRLLSVSAPLGLNRMLMCVLQGIEAALLPQQLQRFGLQSHDALSVYGILTGMTLPLILFPTAVTGAIGTLLLPAVSEARALNEDKKINATVNASFQASIVLGAFFLTGFLLFGRDAGTFLFHNSLSGEYLQKLALICPFLYLNTTLASILHGLGKTTAVFVLNISGFAIRLAAVVFSVPGSGIDGYLAGTIMSQVFVASCTLVMLWHSGNLTVSVLDTFLKSGLLCLVSGIGTFLFYIRMPASFAASFAGLLLGCLLFAALFLIPAWLLMIRKKSSCSKL